MLRSNGGLIGAERSGIDGAGIWSPGDQVAAVRNGTWIPDADVVTYIKAVEAADGMVLEPQVKELIRQFIVGCKADGIWSAIKSCCILAGARTLSGALVPLIGTAPTNYNFVAGDYNRKTGLGGDALNASKYVDTNRPGNSDPQNSKHTAVYMTATGFVLFGNRSATTGSTYLDTGGGGFRCRINTALVTDDATLVVNNGLVGGSRSSSSAGTRRANGTNYSITTASQTPQADSVLLFARRNNTTGAPESFSASRLAFYSIGESIDLQKLDTRVTALVTAIGAAIA
jgi:hypothetical protein